MAADVFVGVIGGTGLGQQLGAVGAGRVVDPDTPFGKPSGPITVTEVAGVRVALLSRHGPGHIHSPSMVPYRANIYALKMLGVTHILAGSAVGSLREDIAPRHLVIPDQVIDKTYRRASTFFDDVVVHAEFADPFSPELRGLLLDLAPDVSVATGTTVHGSGTYVAMEGPQFSTRAESHMHRAWGGHLIGMTLMPEAKLAREAQIAYAAICLVTDYDCWKAHQTHPSSPRAATTESLTAEILGHLKAATANAIELIRLAIPRLAQTGCPAMAHHALSHAVWTDRATIPDTVKRRLALLLNL